jgi:hypothetical protein
VFFQVFSLKQLTVGRPDFEIDKDTKCRLISPTGALKCTLNLIAVLNVLTCIIGG